MGEISLNETNIKIFVFLPTIQGVTRGNGIVTPKYTSTYVFTNDFPALLEDVPTPPAPAGTYLHHCHINIGYDGALAQVPSKRGPWTQNCINLYNS